MQSIACRYTWRSPVTTRGRFTERLQCMSASPCDVCLITSWAMSKKFAMRIPKNPKASNRFNKKTLLFEILSHAPSLTARQLMDRAQHAGIHLTLAGAYRALRLFQEAAGKLEDSDTRSLRAVARILQNAASGEHLTAVEITRKASEQNISIHKASVYRALAKLSSIGLVLAIEHGRQKLYEWRREQEQRHGHLTCIGCGKTIEFHRDDLDVIGERISAWHDYEFVSIEFTVRALCEVCINRNL